jgi:hypothetical protein
MDATHPFLVAVWPLVNRIGATFIAPADLRDGDVPLTWDGSVLAGIRLASTTAAPAADSGADPAGTVSPNRAVESDARGLAGSIEDIERFFGGPLTDLPRERKQQAVRMFEEAGAFSYRKSVETVAAALGVSRFTVYNYLNRDRE